MARMTKKMRDDATAASAAVAEAPAPEPPAAFASETEEERPLTVHVRGMSSTPTIRTQDARGGLVEKRYGYWCGRIPVVDSNGDPTPIPEWAQNLSFDPKSVPDFKPGSRHPGAFYWPAEGQAEYDLTLEQLEEVLADKNVVLMYDPAEVEMLRARLAPTSAAREAALKAAKLEADLAAANARAKMLAAQAAAAEAEKQVAEARARLAEEEARLRARGR